MALDIPAAYGAVATVAERIQLSVEQAAWGILSLASDSMVKAVHEITVKRGLNPRESTIVAGGGAAGLNILMIAKELGSTNVVLPRMASALSATGMHFADVVKEEAEAIIISTSRFDNDRINGVIERIEKKLQEFLARLGLEGREHSVELLAESRYDGQVWDLDVSLPSKRFKSDADRHAFIEAFHQTHERVLAVRDPNSDIEIIAIKGRLVVALGQRAGIDDVAEGGTSDDVYRDCYFGGDEPVKTKIVLPGSVSPGDRIAGPAIIEEPTTTVVVYPGMSATLSTNHNYILDMEG